MTDLSGWRELGLDGEYDVVVEAVPDVGQAAATVQLANDFHVDVARQFPVSVRPVEQERRRSSQPARRVVVRQQLRRQRPPAHRRRDRHRPEVVVVRVPEVGVDDGQLRRRGDRHPLGGGQQRSDVRVLVRDEQVVRLARHRSDRRSAGPFAVFICRAKGKKTSFRSFSVPSFIKYLFVEITLYNSDRTRRFT